jgi:dolichol-phosphate mannosyltransferase
MSTQQTRTTVSLVVPVFNEAQIIGTLFESLQDAIRALPQYDWELILVDDGSTDDTASRIKAQRHRFSAPIVLVRLSRNFGHQPALAAGLSRARGDAIVCLDADLQDPPELLPAFLEKFEAGYDVVYGVRAKRSEAWPKVLAYKLFYRLYQRLSNVQIALDAGDFGLITRRVARLISEMPERDLLLRGLRGWVGFRQIGVPYDRGRRAQGETKYTLAKLTKLAASAFFGYSQVPLRVATALGVGTVALSILYLLFILIRKLTGTQQPAGWASLMGVVLLVSGVQLVTIGILGEYVGRIYQQTQARPLFIVEEEEEM